MTLLRRGYVQIEDGDGARGEAIAIRDGDATVLLSPDDLRWLCLVAGPALLNELGKEATRGND